MRISDWSSDVCSSDLGRGQEAVQAAHIRHLAHLHPHAVDVEGCVKQMQKARVVAILDVFQVQLPVGLGILPRAAEIDHRLVKDAVNPGARSEEHTSELQSLMRTSYAVFCLKKKNTHNKTNT